MLYEDKLQISVHQVGTYKTYLTENIIFIQLLNFHIHYSLSFSLGECFPTRWWGRGSQRHTVVTLSLCWETEKM